MTQFITLPKRAKDITGQRYGRLVALGPVGRSKDKRQIDWLCRCDCGKTTRTEGSRLRAGRVNSCGCLVGDRASEAFKTHGMSHSPIHNIWHAMRSRCTNPNAQAYANYGGRGITVCDEWRHDFQAFYNHVSQLPDYGESGSTLDRIDNDGNYEPGNVRWASREQQCRNKRGNVMLTYNGKTQCMSAWSDELKVRLNTLHFRLSAGWSVEEALTRPVRPIRKKLR